MTHRAAARPRQTATRPFLRTARRACLVAAVALVSAASSAAFAQGGATPFAWAAKVDEEIITGYDVTQRALLLQLEKTNRSGPQLLAQAREELIEETLKLKEAERRGVKTQDKQVAAAVANIARSNRVSEDAFFARLKTAGIDRSAFERRVRASLAWNELLRRGHLSKIQPTEGEIETELNATKASPSGPAVYDVRQIVVDLAPTARRREVEATLRQAVEVRRQLKSCSQIKDLASKYSRISGSVGRITAAQMPPPVRKAVLQLKTGQTTKPMRSQNGWHVIMLCGIQSQGGAKPSAEAIKDRLTARKAEIVSRSLVADLRRDALIELAQ